MNPPQQLPPRLVPDEPLPPYAYVSGRYPHPLRDPSGHSYGRTPRPSSIDLENPLRSRSLLVACDLFNHGYYWEAHEEWEGIWQACGGHGATADMLKGLIHLAAAGVKAREARPDGVRRHAARAAVLLEETRAASGQPRYLGLDLAWLIEQARRLEQTPVVCPAEGEAVRIVFDFHLLPESA